MNILFVCEVDYLKKVVFELQELPELLSMMGHKVYVIDYESMWSKDSSLDFGSFKTKQADNAVRVYPKSSVSLIRPAFVKIPVVSRLSAFLTHYWAIKRVIREKKIDVIVLYSVPTNGLQTIHLAKKYGVPVIFRSIDVLHQLVRNPLLSNLTYVMEQVVYQSVDLVLPNSVGLFEYVTGMGVPSDEVRILPLGVDTDRFKLNSDTNGLREKWGFGKDDKVVLFVGTLYKFSGLDTLVEKFYALSEVMPNVKLLIVGDGEQRQILERKVVELGISRNVIITGYQSYEVIPDCINLADVCICPFLDNETTRDIFPVKIIQYLACGKPVVCTSLPGIKSMIQGEEQGMVYVDDCDEMVNKIISLLKFDDDRQRLGNNAVRFVKEKHDYGMVAKQLERELIKLVEGEVNGTL